MPDRPAPRYVRATRLGRRIDAFCLPAFQPCDFGYTTAVTLGATESCLEKYLDQLPSDRIRRPRGRPGRSHSCRRPRPLGAPKSSHESGTPARPAPCWRQCTHPRHYRRWPRRDPPRREQLHGPGARQNPDSHHPASAGCRQSRPLHSEPRATSPPDIPSTQTLHDRQRYRYVSASWRYCQRIRHCFFSSKANARLQTFSTVNPYSRISTGPGAEAPKWSRPITSPSSPT